MHNKKTENINNITKEKEDKSYLNYRVTPKETSQHYRSKELKVEKRVIKFN